ILVDEKADFTADFETEELVFAGKTVVLTGKLEKLTRNAG
ncbi:DNA ligase, partial [Listeria marthii FSL S4-120]